MVAELHDAGHYIREMDPGAIEIFKKNGQVSPIYFVFEDEGPIVVPLVFLGKRDMNEALRLLFHGKPSVRAGIFICESWVATLEKGQPRPQGEIKDMPGRRDAITYIAEARMVGGSITRAIGRRFVNCKTREVEDLELLAVPEEESREASGSRQLGLGIL